MDYFIKILLLIISNSFLLIPFPIAADSPAVDDEAICAFVGGIGNFEQICAQNEVTNEQSKDLLVQIYDSHLGILHYMKQNWHCAGLFGITHCEEYRKYLGILYLHFSDIYAGISTKKPSFMTKNGEIRLTFVEVVERLANIFKFCHGSKLAEENAKEWEGMGLILRNEEQINAYKANSEDKTKGKGKQKAKMEESPQAKFDEMVKNKFKTIEQNAKRNAKSGGRGARGEQSGSSSTSARENQSGSPTSARGEQLGSSSLARENQTGFSSLSAWENQSGSPTSARGNQSGSSTSSPALSPFSSASAFSPLFSSSPLSQPPASLSVSSSTAANAEHIYNIILNMPIHSMADAIKDEAFIAFVNESNNCENILGHIIRRTWRMKQYFRQTIEDFIKSYEIHLGLVHLMRKNWRCANAKVKNENECKKLRRYLDILYEYLVRVRYRVRAVKPMFQMHGKQRTHIRNLVKIVELMNAISKYYFGTNSENSEEEKELLEDAVEAAQTLQLSNENELNYDGNSEISEIKFKENVVQMAFESSSTVGTELSGIHMEGLLRHNFDMHLEEMIEKWLKLASEKKAEMDALEEEIDNIVLLSPKRKEKQKLYKEKASEFKSQFHPLIVSPFIDL